MASDYKVPILENFEWQKPVVDRLTAPPAHTKGNRYLIIATASGDWSGKENQIAISDGAAWSYILPIEGMIVWVDDEDVYYKYSGSAWAVFSSGLLNIVEDTTPQLGGDLDLNGKNIDFPTTANISDCLDEDNMASNSNTKLATQQSIKAYVDNISKVSIHSKTNTTTTFTDPDTTERLMGSVLIGAEVLATTNGIRITACLRTHVDWYSPAPNITIRWRIGTNGTIADTLLVTNSFTTPLADDTDEYHYVNFVLFNTSATVQRAINFVQMGTGFATGYGTGAQNTANQFYLDLTMQSSKSTSGGDHFDCMMFIIELLK